MAHRKLCPVHVLSGHAAYFARQQPRAWQKKHEAYPRVYLACNETGRHLTGTSRLYYQSWDYFLVVSAARFHLRAAWCGDLQKPLVLQSFSMAKLWPGHEKTLQPLQLRHAVMLARKATKYRLLSVFFPYIHRLASRHFARVLDATANSSCQYHFLPLK